MLTSITQADTLARAYKHIAILKCESLTVVPCDVPGYAWTINYLDRSGKKRWSNVTTGSLYSELFEILKEHYITVFQYPLTDRTR